VLTTATTSGIRDNVVTDLNANVPLPDAPKPRVISREAALLFNKSVVAKPLMVPEVSSIRVKNTEYMYRWVFLGERGQMYTKRKAQGFTNATIEDVEVLGGDCTSDKGEIRAGDLILMKIRGDLYDAAIKYNMERALLMQRARGMYLKGDTSQNVMSDGQASGASIGQENFRGKASNFIPDNPDALLSSSALNGGLEAAREQETQIREKIAADKASKKS
jgi:hypothetical protein